MLLLLLMMMMSKKTIDIFNYKQQLLSIDMKTKVVQQSACPMDHFNAFKVFEFSRVQVFNFKQRLLRLDMKTKIVQHVESD